MTPSQHPDRIPALDGIRGIAILTVLVFHFVELPHALQASLSPASRVLFGALRVGWLGVDVFFVLSGFLITSILLRTCTEPRYFQRFYWRRALRILPLYYGALIFVALLLTFRPPHTTEMQAASHQIWLWLFLANVALSLSIPLTLPHFWSLAVEEHFYLVWPWIVKRARRRFVHVCLFVILASWVGRCVGVWFLRPDSLYLFTPFRLDALGAGALLAVLVQQGKLPRLVPLAKIAAPLAIVAFALLHLRFNFSRADGIPQALFGYTALDITAVSMIVLALAQPPVSLWRRFLEQRLLRVYGKFSYAIYIFHVPLHAILWAAYSRLTFFARPFLANKVMLDIVIFTVFASAACLFAGFCSWHLLEKRLLKYRNALDFPRVSAEKALAAASAE